MKFVVELYVDGRLEWEEESHVPLPIPRADDVVLIGTSMIDYRVDHVQWEYFHGLTTARVMCKRKD